MFSGLDQLPFVPYRRELYTYEELTAVARRSRRGTTFDARVGAVVRVVHLVDARRVDPRPCTTPRSTRPSPGSSSGAGSSGVMGGHALDRDAAFYRTVAVTGRMLTRAGFTVTTGGGPGVMEAANLGAWMAPFDDAALDEALAMLAEAPNYRR